MTSPDPAAILAQINAAREQTYQNIATAQGILDQANAAASAAARDRAAIQAIAQQTVSVDTSVGTRVFAGDEMIHGDTGWLDISAEVTNLAFTGGIHGALIRRIGQEVRLRIFGVTVETVGVLFPLPVPFRPSRLAYGTIGYLGNYAMGTYQYSLHTMSSLGRLDIQPLSGLSGHEAGRSIAGEFSWTTDASWPTSLPGTAG